MALLEGMAIFYCPIFKITEAEYEQMLVDFAEELNQYQSYMREYRLVIRKLDNNNESDGGLVINNATC